MSWQGYLDDILKGKNVKLAAIIDIKKGKVLVASPSLKFIEHSVELKDLEGKVVKSKINELESVIQMAKDDNPPPSPPGVWINTQQYRYIAKEDNIVHLKKLLGGATIVKTKKLVLVGIWEQQNKDDKIRAGNAVMDLTKIADELIEAKY